MSSHPSLCTRICLGQLNGRGVTSSATNLQALLDCVLEIHTCNHKDVVGSILPIKPWPPPPDFGQQVVHVVGGMGPEDPSVEVEEVSLLRIVRCVG